MTLRVSLLLLLVSSSGCGLSYLRPPHPRGIPVRHALETVGGRHLTVEDDGTLVSYLDPWDVEAQLGASLAEVHSRVEVTGVLRADSPFVVGDRLVSVLPLLLSTAEAIAGVQSSVIPIPPRLPEGDSDRREAQRAAVALCAVRAQLEPDADWEAVAESVSVEEGPSSVELFLAARGWEGDQRDLLRTVLQELEDDALERFAAALALQRVRKIADLQGYGMVPTVLLCQVERGRTKQTVFVTVGSREVVPARLHRADKTRKNGYEAVRVADLPAGLAPVQAAREDALLVTRVRVDSASGVGGKRPLQLDHMVYSGEESRDMRTHLLSLADDPTRSHGGFGPFDWLAHTHEEKVYDPRRDAYLRHSRSSLLSVIQWAVGGSDDYTHVREFRLGLFDTPKVLYWVETMEGLDGKGPDPMTRHENALWNQSILD